eukprot:TRINITY_DN66425_c10_g9_i1.p2 TRINITY_DN66425_c10_g9~~TRINITY_DN66425_c10_g9_i1.p2  ORF type:complete len:304 (-),score=146.89 TRINITY_DN66425_c10_g9_i1:113-1024(-)
MNGFFSHVNNNNSNNNSSSTASSAVVESLDDDEVLESRRRQQEEQEKQQTVNDKPRKQRFTNTETSGPDNALIRGLGLGQVMLGIAQQACGLADPDALRELLLLNVERGNIDAATVSSHFVMSSQLGDAAVNSDVLNDGEDEDELIEKAESIEDDEELYEWYQRREYVGFRPHGGPVTLLMAVILSGRGEWQAMTVLDVFGDNPQFDADAKTRTGWSALTCALLMDQPHVVARLLSKHHVTAYAPRRTPTYALMYGQKSVVREHLLSVRRQLQVELANHINSFPHHEAVLIPDVVGILVQYVY